MHTSFVYDPFFFFHGGFQEEYITWGLLAHPDPSEISETLKATHQQQIKFEAMSITVESLPSNANVDPVSISIVELPTANISDVEAEQNPESAISSKSNKLGVNGTLGASATSDDLYQYLVYKSSSLTPRVWSGRKTNFYYPGDEGMYSCINRFLESINWVQLISWKNDTAATQTYQYSYTTGLTITEGREVNEGFNLGLSFFGMSIGYNHSTRTFKSTETTTSQTTTIDVNVPPHSLLVFYQRRYDFRDEITFICDAWGREWNIGPWGGYSPLVKKIAKVQIMAEEYFTSAVYLPSGPGSIVTDTVPPAPITDITRKRENVTKKSKAVLDRMGL
ncbi:hypothetical protein CVT24_006463 [Panaeolus cyanescens]|uniref:Uncharacterized protein n=1 Tax=Panaeolus cyanescens TaxID=181874 RepID=A0A409WIR1_9AGAR|nr:hypothetical protein CVT24_006463 [Panaeolus cyanescens]